MPRDQKYNKAHEITTINTANQFPPNNKYPTQPSFLVLQRHSAITLKNRTGFPPAKGAEMLFHKVSKMTGNALGQEEQEKTKPFSSRAWCRGGDQKGIIGISREHQNTEHRMRNEVD